MSQATNKTQYFQWVKGEFPGKIVEWNGEITRDGDIDFLVFVDGSLGNSALLGDYFFEIVSPNEPIMLPNEMDPFQKKGPVQPIQQPVQQVPQHDPFAITPKKPEKAENPIFSLLEKSIKSSSIQNFQVTIEMPPHELVKIVAGSFENGQEEVLDYLVSKISIDDMRKQLKDKLRENIFVEKPKRKRA